MIHIYAILIGLGVTALLVAILLWLDKKYDLWIMNDTMHTIVGNIFQIIRSQNRNAFASNILGAGFNANSYARHTNMLVGILGAFSGNK